VSASGGTASALTTLDAANPAAHGWPYLLPDGRHFVYARLKGYLAGNVIISSLDKPQDPPVRILPDDVFVPAYAPSPDPKIGYLLFVRRTAPGAPDGRLMAQPFENRRLKLAGSPVTIADHVDAGSFSASQTGVLVYRSGPPLLAPAAVGLVHGEMTLFDRQGKVLLKIGEPAEYLTVSLSSDGTRAAFDRVETPQRGDIWLYEFERGLTTRFTFDPALNFGSAWSPDSHMIAFRGFQERVHMKASNQEGSEEPLGDLRQLRPASWSRDGRFLLTMGTIDPKKNSGLSLLSVDTRKTSVLLDTEFDEWDARFSPDERYIAYSSDQAGRQEIYVRPFDPASRSLTGGQWVLSNGGGVAARWRGDGKELFYIAQQAM
jgi:hypothetical protein